MTDLRIPDEATDLRFYCACGNADCDRVGYQPDALPLVVAAELRRLADVLKARARGMHLACSVGMDEAMRVLQVRADELTDS